MLGSLHSALASAVLRLLRPLVRILLRNGISYGAFAELAKKTYVDVAAEEFTAAGRKVNISRIAALTGLTRKEAKRLHEWRQPEGGDSNKRYNRAIRVLSGWVHDADFQDARGRPVDLPMTGDSSSFAELVRRYSGDVPPRAMLAVLEAGGSIRLEDERVVLLHHAYVPGSDPVDKIAILGTDSAELMDTIDHNLTAPPDDLRYQRKVSTHALHRDALPAFRALSSARAQALLEELDEWLSRHEAEQGEEKEARYVSLGIYYYEDRDSPGGGNE